MRLKHSKLIFAAALIPLVLALAGPAAPSTSASSPLTNGGTAGPRGIPSSGAYMGGAYGANTNLSRWETALGGKSLGVHRTYWGSSYSSAVKTAKADAARNRVPWMSFKPPYSWSAMANGKGDAWARGLARAMKTVNGPSGSPSTTSPRATATSRLGSGCRHVSRRSCAPRRRTSATASS